MRCHGIACLNSFPGAYPVQVTMMSRSRRELVRVLMLAKGTLEIPAPARHPEGEGKGSMVGMVWE